MTEQISKQELLDRIEQGWAVMQTYLDTLSEAQLTGPTDAAGWTAKDHIMHMAVWENGIYALVSKKPRWEGMGLERDVFVSGDYDHMNALIQQQHAAKPLDEVLAHFTEVHERLVKKLRWLSDEELQQPYRVYQPDSDRDAPVIGWVAGNTYEHYTEHQPWIAAIVTAE